MTNINIGFVGGGNMARSLIGGMLNKGWDNATIRVGEPDPEKRRFFTNQMGIGAHADNLDLIDSCATLVLAVKPQALHEVCASLSSQVQKHQPLVLSIAAGVRATDIEHWLGGDLAVVRAMPNTPALVGSGASALHANSRVTGPQREIAERVMRSVGVVVWLDDETLLDTVTALSGSGPAYFLLIMEALQAAAHEQGLDADTARLLTLETCLGAAKLALESGEELAELRRRVTSPGGTTEAALAVMEKRGLVPILQASVAAATQRSRELAEVLGK